jgi:sporulation protein YlmC with PRC-barrel domain
MGEYRRTMSTSSLSGDKVYNHQEEELGKIEDFMVDTVDGCISYAVLSFGSFLGMGGKYFAIPWKSLSLDEDNHRFLLDISKERLEQAPGFDKDNWPDMSSDEFSTQVHSFWGGGMEGRGRRIA